MNVGDRFKVLNGSKALSVRKYETGKVEEIIEMGPDYGYNVRVVLRLGTRRIPLYVRHPNRLLDAQIKLHNGNPLNNIRIAVVAG